METLLVLPSSVACAAENMARDWLMLDGFAGPDLPRLRTYGWSRPAWTFGYSQQWDAVRAKAGEQGECVRRPTGGGLVDHRNDWTYALVLPATHPLAQAKAVESYHAVHQALAEALKAFAVPVVLKAAKAGASQKAAAVTSVCFIQAEPYDLVRADDGRKIAGAAQKRTKQGLLLQGSISRGAVPEMKQWDLLALNFATALGQTLAAQPEHSPQNAFPSGLLSELSMRFSSVAWNQRR
jgi:lipoate-protein ligase A